MKTQKPLVGIIMGSQSDLHIMGLAADILESFGVAYELTIVSAHRTPERMYAYAKTAQKRGLKVLIAGAGCAAHLPGMVAALTTLPVIGVPIQSAHSLKGFDSLLSIVQMPEGVPVATVAVDGAKNAGILAAQILALNDDGLDLALKQYKESLKKKVETMVKTVARQGHRVLRGL